MCYKTKPNLLHSTAVQSLYTAWHCSYITYIGVSSLASASCHGWKCTVRNYENVKIFKKMFDCDIVYCTSHESSFGDIIEQLRPDREQGFGIHNDQSDLSKYRCTSCNKRWKR